MITRLVSTLLLLLGLGACEDAIGPGGGCRSEMSDVRRQYGQPDSNQREERSGDYTERWIFHSTPSQPGRVYTFRWGVSYDRCVVSFGPLSDLVPEGEVIPPAGHVRGS